MNKRSKEILIFVCVFALGLSLTGKLLLSGCDDILYAIENGNMSIALDGIMAVMFAIIAPFTASYIVMATNRIK